MKNKSERPITLQRFITIIATIFAVGLVAYFIIGLIIDNTLVKLVGALLVSFIPEKTIFKEDFAKVKAFAEKQKMSKPKDKGGK